MTSLPRFEGNLPGILEDLYLGPSPDYRDVLIAGVQRTRQRPAWAFPERWLPVDITNRLAFAPRLPYRHLAIVALLAILTAAAAISSRVNLVRRAPGSGRVQTSWAAMRAVRSSSSAALRASSADALSTLAPRRSATCSTLRAAFCDAAAWGPWCAGPRWGCDDCPESPLAIRTVYC